MTLPTYHATKYDSARDEVIALLADELEGYGQRDDATGDVDAPTGWFALVTIPADVCLTGPAMSGLGIDAIVSNLANEYGVAPADVAGTHIVTHNSQGFVSVETFDSEEEARAAFECRADHYAEWSSDEYGEDGNDGRIYVCKVQGHGYHSL
jgi:hypothetical protein